jgi:hypothetical protein
MHWNCSDFQLNCQLSLSLSLMLQPTVSRAVCLGIKHPSGAYDQIFITVRQLRVWWCGVLSLTRGQVCRLQLLLALDSAVILGFAPVGLATIFYCLRFEISLFVASYDSQGYRGGIPPRLHTGYSVRVRVTITLRLAVYRQSVRLGAKPLETHGQIFFQLNTCGNNPYVASLWRENGFISYEYAWSSSMLLKLFILHYKQHYTTSHVVWDESLKAESHLYASLKAVYWAHRAICTKYYDSERHMKSTAISLH